MLKFTSTEVFPEKRSEVISGKYIVQYAFAAGSSAVVVPLIKSIGVGWTFTICKKPLRKAFLTSLMWRVCAS